MGDIFDKKTFTVLTVKLKKNQWKKTLWSPLVGVLWNREPKFSNIYEQELTPLDWCMKYWNQKQKFINRSYLPDPAKYSQLIKNYFHNFGGVPGGIPGGVELDFFWNIVCDVLSVEKGLVLLPWRYLTTIVVKAYLRHPL